VEIYLDDRPMDVAGAEHLTVQQVALSLQSQLQGHGRLLTTILCDGEPVATARLDDVLGSLTGQFARIEFQSSDARGLAIESLREVGATLAQADPSRTLAADRLNQGQVGSGMEALGECFRAWGRAHEAVVKVSALLNLDLSEEQVGDRPVAEWLEDVRDRLNEIKGAIEANDYVTVSDCLRYELDGLSGEWGQLIDALITRADAA
jgi:hypothetical protein